MRFWLVVALLLVVPSAAALPTPGFNGAASDATLGRIFPEALQTNDYVSYEEAIAGLQTLVEENPDRLEMLELGDSLGWENPATGERVTGKIFAVEVTNEESPVAAERKLTVVFFLSIHGNEKGGREGGLRVIEDLARGTGIAAEEPELVEMLDYQRLVFIFANADGWRHEEVENRAANADPADPAMTLAPGYTRENANFTDLNRQFPTVGYLFEDYTPLSEPESRVMVDYTRSLTNVVAGADVHGMLQNTNLVRMLLKDGEKSQQLLFENQRLAELYKERLNGNPHYDNFWASLPDQPGVCCGQVAEWAATFDAIGYSASGTAGAWIVQRQGLNAPGYTVEFAYNHLAFDNYYPGAGAIFNDYHVEAMRDITSVFMRFASEKVNLSVETNGLRTAVLSSAYVATNADDDKSAYGGWFAQNELDDAYDIQNNPFTATPQAYWTDLARFAKNGEAAGVVDSFDDPRALVSRLESYDNVVIPGSAYARVDKETADALAAWVKEGGHLVLTDAALQLVPQLGIDATPGNKSAYSGYTDLVDREHPYTSNLAGFPRQTYDPNPLGFAPGASPVWFVDRAGWEAAGGVTLGGVGKEGTGEAVVESPAACDQGTPVVPPVAMRDNREAHAGEGLELPLVRAPVVVPAASAAFERGVDCAELDATNLGVVPLGAGRVSIFGAILPDPTEESNHPYGLDNHAVAANGNLVILNMLGAEYVFTTPPAVDELALFEAPSGVAPAAVGDEKVPAPGLLVLAAAAIAAALLARRRG